MSIQHRDIPEAQLHEPKGVSTALADQVYVSNGSGGGAWSTQHVEFTNFLEVLSLSDLPTPIGGEIFLAASTAYFISGAVDISPNRIVINSTGSALRGLNRATDILISNVAAALVTSTNQSVTFTGLTLANTHASGTLLNLSNSGGHVVILDKVFFADCASIGTFGDFSNIIFDNCGISTAVSPVGGMIFTGSNHTEILVRDSFFSNWTGILLDLGTSVTTYVELQGSRFLGTASAVALDGLPNAGNIGVGGLGIVNACLFDGMTNPIGTNIDHADMGWFFSSTVGTQASAFVGYMSMTGNTTNTTLTQNVWTKVAGTTVAFADNERFSMSANNELTAGVILPRPIVIDISLSSLKSGGGTDRVEFTVFKDSGSGFVQLNTDVVSGKDSSASLGSLALTMLDTALPADKYSLYVQNTTSGSDVEITDLQFRIRG